MVDMIERVARAMHDAYEIAAKTHGWGTHPECQVPFDDLPENNKAVMLVSARAAIEAMREPTEEMVAAREGFEYDHEAAWQAMIDAALGESGDG